MAVEIRRCCKQFTSFLILANYGLHLKTKLLIEKFKHFFKTQVFSFFFFCCASFLYSKQSLFIEKFRFNKFSAAAAITKLSI